MTTTTTIPPPNEPESLEKKAEDRKWVFSAERARTQHLCRQLQTRLKYARLKVTNGWHNRTLDEVEDLYFSQHPPRSPMDALNHLQGSESAFSESRSSLLFRSASEASFNRQSYEHLSDPTPSPLLVANPAAVVLERVHAAMATSAGVPRITQPVILPLTPPPEPEHRLGRAINKDPDVHMEDGIEDHVDAHAKPNTPTDSQATSPSPTPIDETDTKQPMLLAEPFVLKDSHHHSSTSPTPTDIALSPTSEMCLDTTEEIVAITATIPCAPDTIDNAILVATQKGSMVIPTYNYGNPALTYDSFWSTLGMGKVVQ